MIEGLSVHAGPQFGILVDADGGTEGFKKTNFGLNIGAGYELAGGIFFDARYTIGVSDIADLDGYDTGGYDLSVKTRNFQIGFGYRF
ncbi:outer membrane beta-barrel protein [Sinomicrobium sp.]